MPAPSLGVVVGNDVVDLTARRTVGRSRDQRFIERVFTEVEAATIDGAEDPDLELWHAWAAKESAYKVVSKLLAEPPAFAHRAFEVVWTGDGHRAGRFRDGRVRYGSFIIPVQGEVLANRGALHVVALCGEAAASPSPGELVRAVDRLRRPGALWNASLDELRQHLTERERDAVHSHASAAVRVGAREATARLLGMEPHRIEIVCRPGPLGRRPPTVLVDGERGTLDVSLSHDGPWIAWTISTDEPPAGPTATDTPPLPNP